ncbi:MAG: glycine cleavage system aminomethyltransferase GcvT [Boseongicola sp. SB0677_bin_26]|nr:glycine cleavage system aminomethyltransferase GcvT [Boseongicola sp. SB0665_bin_10]MYG27069.1 glycine cleavage system aminomethyltransferase GcvT [Boseongicola sp. SB0677_bin_26]
MPNLSRTPLHDLHCELDARMVPFAGYEMPVQYYDGVLWEHLHTRSSAGLFDVSHMGQVRVCADSLEEAQIALEALVPVSVLGIPEGRQRYGLFTDEAGGILDDLMIANRGDDLLLVVNAATRAQDIAHLSANLAGCSVTPLIDRALLALQGPASEAALAALVPGVAEMRFMDTSALDWNGVELWVSRSGYTGEDGYEVSIPSSRARALAEALLASEAVIPIGLGARDSLRLEAGLCLYGSDIDTSTTPVEAGLEWAIQKARRRGGEREGGFPGASRILDELESGAPRRRVGFLPDGRAPIRAGARIFREGSDDPVGEVTSGGFGPSLGRPVSMGYVETGLSGTGTALEAEVRGKRMPVTVADLPFRPSTFKR